MFLKYNISEHKINNSKKGLMNKYIFSGIIDEIVKIIVHS